MFRETNRHVIQSVGTKIFSVGFCNDIAVNEMVLWLVLVIITFMPSFESSGRHVRELIERNLKNM